MGRLLAGFLSFLVSIQLTVGQHTLVLVDTAQAQTCAAGQKLDPIMGRCLSTEQASQVASATSSCAGAGDEAAQKKCYLQAAEAALANAVANGDVKGAGKVSPDMLSMILTLGGLGASAMFLATGGPARCGPFTISAAIIAASSVAALMGEITASMTYKNKMNKANETLKKINEGSAGTSASGTTSNVMNATNVQEEAFKALIEKEEAVIAAAQTKKKLYSLALVGYAAATVMAGVEVVKALFPPTTAGTKCFGSVKPSHLTDDGTMVAQYLNNFFEQKQRVSFSAYTNSRLVSTSKDLPSLLTNLWEIELIQSGKYRSASIAEHAQNQKNFSNFITDDVFKVLKIFAANLNPVSVPSSHAVLLAILPAGVFSPGVVAAATTQATLLQRMFTDAPLRLALAGVLTANAMMAKGKAGKEESKAKDRKSFLEQLRLQVVQGGNGVNCASADAAQATAACKTNGTDNITPNGATGANGLTAAEFSATGVNDVTLSTPRCVTNTGSFDSACSCKNNNTCLSIGNSISGSVPSGVSLGSVPSTLDAVTGGTLAGSNLNEADLSAQAARLNNLNQNLSKKNPAIAKANTDAKKKAEQISADLAKSLGSSPALAAASPAGESLLEAKTPEQALEKLKNELSQEINKVEGQAAAANGTKSDLDLTGLDDTPVDASVAAPSDKLAEVMASEYEMGNNDINTETSTSIFDIVSNRYKRSGIRRLLGSEQLIPADGAASSDINR